ncbi:MAG: GTP-binding protein [Nonlabens sp.]
MSNQYKKLLRFATAGSVDDGKSTFIGRLLYDTKSIYKDQLEAVAHRTDGDTGKKIDLSYLTDGLKEERELGITKDVAYRYFSTSKRKFIIADSPGHAQYTKYMFTAVSTVNVVVIIVDVTQGITEQTKRHTLISSMLEIEHLIVCFNKMDLVNYSEVHYNQRVSEHKDFVSSLNFKNINYLPISALLGDNMVAKSKKMEWYSGSTFLDCIESLEFNTKTENSGFTLPIQSVINHVTANGDAVNLIAGKLATGMIAKGDSFTILPSKKTSSISSIFSGFEKLANAAAGRSITVSLSSDIIVKRGDIIVSNQLKPIKSKSLEVILCWLDDKDLKINTNYRIIHCHSHNIGKIEKINHKIDIRNNEKLTLVDKISKNDIAEVKLSLQSSMFYEPYKTNKSLGRMILVDIQNNDTVAAGIVI